MIDVSGDSVRLSQHVVTLTLTLNSNPVTLRTSELSPVSRPAYIDDDALSRLSLYNEGIAAA